MRKLLEHCPACGDDMIVTQQSCICCGTAVVGEFQPTIFAKLSPQSLQFVEIFVKNKGNIKEMERELGNSYWSIRNRLNDVIAELGFDARPDEDEQMPGSQAQTAVRQSILKRLDDGEIDVHEAAHLLQQLRQ